MNDLTPAQAAQQSNREAGGQYAEKTHGEPTASLEDQLDTSSDELVQINDAVASLGTDLGITADSFADPDAYDAWVDELTHTIHDQVSRARADAPQGDSAPDDEAECSCTLVENPYHHFGAVEPGGAIEPDYDCPVHFPNGSGNSLAFPVHTFEDSAQAYDRTQTDGSIKSGDMLIVESEGIVGFLHQAWPIAVSESHGSLHKVKDKDEFLGQFPEQRDVWEACERRILADSFEVADPLSWDDEPSSAR